MNSYFNKHSLAEPNYRKRLENFAKLLSQPKSVLELCDLCHLSKPSCYQRLKDLACIGIQVQVEKRRVSPVGPLTTFYFVSNS